MKSSIHVCVSTSGVSATDQMELNCGEDRSSNILPSQCTLMMQASKVVEQNVYNQSVLYKRCIVVAHHPMIIRTQNLAS